MKHFLFAGFGAFAVVAALSSPAPAAASLHPGDPAKQIAVLRSAAVHVSLRVSAAVHVSLRVSAAVAADADGFFTLGSIADITGGAASARARLGAVTVGRAPLADSVRRLTSDDVALKLRQAGLDPSRDAVIEGAPQTSVTLASTPSEAPGGAVSPSSNTHAHTPASPAAPSPIVVKRGDPVAIVLQEDGLSISTSGVARDSGALGDEIRVHRDGSPTDLSAIVLDERTVQLEL